MGRLEVMDLGIVFESSSLLSVNLSQFQFLSDRIADGYETAEVALLACAGGNLVLAVRLG